MKNEQVMQPMGFEELFSKKRKKSDDATLLENQLIDYHRPFNAS